MYNKKSLLENNWLLREYDERKSLLISQRFNISNSLSKLLSLRSVEINEIENFLKPNFNNNIPDPFLLKDMEKSINRTIEAIEDNHNIGIISDYDVDGSTSAAILYNFLISLNVDAKIKIPNRLTEGYGPNKRIMDEFKKEKVDLIFSLDCGTSSFGILDHKDYEKIDVIVIDHHISEKKLPNIFSIINPNRVDENNDLINLAAVGVTFLFILALRKILRKKKYFEKKIKEPNLLKYLDLVALGTICDVVNLDIYNRNFVLKGLEIINKRHHIGLAKIFEKSKINHTPTSKDLGFIVGPQLNAASRIDDPFLASKILISNNFLEIDKISNKLILLNEKRKLIENNIFEQAIEQAIKQNNDKFIFVHGFGWHTGVLGIISSRLTDKFYKPSIVISFNNQYGIGSCRSIEPINLGNIILNAKIENILIHGGGHKMAAGLKINKSNLDKFKLYLKNTFLKIEQSVYKKKLIYDLKISVDEVNQELLENIEKLEPFGKGNEEPKFIITGLKIDHFKILNNKHILVFFKTNFNKNIKAICFNSIGTKLGDYLINNLNLIYEFGCTIRRDKFKDNDEPQLIIEDAIIIN